VQEAWNGIEVGMFFIFFPSLFDSCSLIYGCGRVPGRVPNLIKMKTAVVVQRRKECSPTYVEVIPKIKIEARTKTPGKLEKCKYNENLQN